MYRSGVCDSSVSESVAAGARRDVDFPPTRFRAWLDMLSTYYFILS